jgi:hypothetical protein
MFEQGEEVLAELAVPLAQSQPVQVGLSAAARGGASPTPGEMRVGQVSIGDWRHGVSDFSRR